MCDGLVEEYRVQVHLVVLGSGKPLIDCGERSMTALHLDEARPPSASLLPLTHQRAG
jgi:hypothetical protein